MTSTTLSVCLLSDVKKNTTAVLSTALLATIMVRATLVGHDEIAKAQAFLDDYERAFKEKKQELFEHFEKQECFMCMGAARHTGCLQPSCLWSRCARKMSDSCAHCRIS